LGLAAVEAGAAETTTTIMTGKTTGTYIRFGQDIAGVARHFGLELTVAPSAGSLENVEAVLRRPRTPLGIVQSDVLDFVATFADDPELRKTASQMRMVFPLYTEEVHLLAGPDVRSLGDLAGKRVAVGSPNSGTLLTATLVLGTAGVEPAEEVEIDTDEALAALRNGQVDAMFYVAGRPARLFAQNVTEADKLHLVPITDPEVVEVYQRSLIPAGTYPWQKDEVATVGVRAVLMTYDYSRRTAYQRAACDTVGKIARMVASNLDWLRGAGRGHPKWQEVDLSAEQVQWQRSACAEEGLRGPVDYVVTPKAQSCDGIDNAIRHKLCLVKQQMRQEAPQAAAARIM
jgi:TRAP transporter TAXI family solute receptor